MIKKIDDPKKLLLHISRLFAKPGKWTRGACARNMQRRPVDESSPTAVCFCSTGALELFAGSVATESAARHALYQTVFNRACVNEERDLGAIVDWNDARGPRGAGVVSRAFAQAAASL